MTGIAGGQRASTCAILHSIKERPWQLRDRCSGLRRQRCAHRPRRPICLKCGIVVSVRRRSWTRWSRGWSALKRCGSAGPSRSGLLTWATCAASVSRHPLLGRLMRHARDAGRSSRLRPCSRGIMQHGGRYTAAPRVRRLFPGQRPSVGQDDHPAASGCDQWIPHVSRGQKIEAVTVTLIMLAATISLVLGLLTS